MKKALFLASIILVVTVCQSMTTSADSPISNSLKDISSHWARASIEGAVKSGYVDGYEDGSFKPDSEISRAEFVKLVAAATKSKSIATVEGDNWYKPYIKELQDQGVLSQSFYSDDMMVPITRGEMAVIATKSVDKASNGNFVDATKLGLIHGLSGGELAPDGKTTRAQAVTVIERILAAKRGEKLPVDKYAMSKAEIEATGSNVGTMLGLKPKEIGTVWTYGTGVTVKLNQLIIADPSDPEDPFMPLIDMETFDETLDKTKNTVVLANFTVTVDQSGVDQNVSLFPEQVLTLLDQTGAFLLKDAVQLKRWIRFDKPKIQTGFVAYAGKRNLVSREFGFDILGEHIKLATK
ncbi:hypothetical protein ASG89_03745 [Paenibacillus sp. Soil766]|uniref:S-layer homology domain-containing protein n=1 Tax=Paenibacillus sp. Soil766 TaxID=1736404 RepID=UPI000709E016|nr:S-layer homology domain-containing protein [Paenibacillus sp. Soil766]KRF03877.1 hypothetical protein ASG89_03745 [Paenibacillus sp. Soil766]